MRVAIAAIVTLLMVVPTFGDDKVDDFGFLKPDKNLYIWNKNKKFEKGKKINRSDLVTPRSDRKDGTTDAYVPRMKDDYYLIGGWAAEGDITNPSRGVTSSIKNNVDSYTTKDGSEVAMPWVKETPIDVLDCEANRCLVGLWVKKSDIKLLGGGGAFSGYSSQKKASAPRHVPTKIIP